MALPGFGSPVKWKTLQTQHEHMFDWQVKKNIAAVLPVLS
jgi:hypothetical protein